MSYYLFLTHFILVSIQTKSAQVLHLPCRWSLIFSPKGLPAQFKGGKDIQLLIFVWLRTGDGPVLTYILSAGILERSQFFLHFSPGKVRGTKKG